MIKDKRMVPLEDYERLLESRDALLGASRNPDDIIEIEYLRSVLYEGRDRIGALLSKGGFSEICTESATREWMHEATKVLNK